MAYTRKENKSGAPKRKERVRTSTASEYVRDRRCSRDKAAHHPADTKAGATPLPYSSCLSSHERQLLLIERGRRRVVQSPDVLQMTWPLMCIHTSDYCYCLFRGHI